MSSPKPVDLLRACPRVLSTRFGIEQRTSKGGVKIRTIDDFSMSGVNATIVSYEAIRHDHVDDLADIAKVIHQAGHHVVFIKVDFKSAYRTPEH